MTAFRFRLEPVLSQREKREQQAVLEQTTAHRDYLQALELLEQTTQKLEHFLRPGTDINYFDAVNSLMYCQFLKQQAETQKNRVDKSRERLENCRQKTVKARKDKLVLEKLKQNLYAKHIRNLNLAEQKENDELGTRMSVQNRSGVTR